MSGKIFSIDGLFILSSRPQGEILGCSKIKLLRFLISPGSGAEKILIKPLVVILQYGLAQPAAQVKVVGDIVYGHEDEGCDFICHVEMADIAAGEGAAGIARTGCIERCEVVFIAGIFYAQLAM